MRRAAARTWKGKRRSEFPPELYDEEAEAPPWCDRCGWYHFGDCDES